MQSAEIELKFPVQDPALLQSRLPGLGFRLVTHRTFEANTLFDTPDRTLRNSRQILRVRRYGNTWTLTHKRTTPNDDPSSRYKTRIETETTVEDGQALAEVFHQLGYEPAFRYDKFRTEWAAEADPAGHLVLDETPIGNFAELEGAPAWIDQTLERLHVDPATCLTDSYGKLFLTWKARTHSPAENLTFEEIAQPAAIAEALQTASH
jgi:adenylate cyclase class 2